ncbi:FtsK/SpoIIIE domain-containing protein [Actinoplanes oblitus]|uniref:FtsK/SpoIIIE domain-containing protein n=1 Tax=Actinoplanes oblitus TaxID=3040509 RepID=A0ABY8WAZ7_9ACTN|nr:FtsK/SpoIIIE domain-containing protein [Actinoplanes oblitus]WIM93569.1 FtsK/SpoIIIE domain-containing protein [Actinoplanes oblitus]
MSPDDRAPADLPRPPRDRTDTAPPADRVPAGPPRDRTDTAPPPGDRLRVAIGQAADGTPVRLDLKESADGGMGPHGLVAGAGTPELLRAVVLGLAATHVPDEVTFVLLDAATGAFDGLDRLPHTAVLLDASRPDLVPRLIEALEGESARRKRLLVAAGCASHGAYLRKTANHPPMPALVLVGQQVSALLGAHPELADVLRRLGWLGRARGIHLLLSAATDPEVHGLAGYLSYRIALPGAPAFILDSPAAGPVLPGHAVLRTGTNRTVPFTPVGPTPPGATPVGATPVRPTRSGSAPAGPAPVGTTPAGATPVSATPVGSALDRLFTGPPPTHRIWLPPLDISPTLDELAGPAVSDPDHGLAFADRSLHGALQVPLAALDKPRDHRRDTIWLPVAGNVAVVGAAGSGKTTILRTIIAALSLSPGTPAARIVAPDSVAAGYQRLPLVHGVLGTSSATDDLKRDLYTRLDDPHGDTIVMIDGWAEFRAAHPHWHELLLEIAQRGTARGVHLIATATHWSDFDQGFTDYFGSRLELRLADPAESAINPATAATIPPGRPGRGIVAAPKGALHFLAARPELTATPEADLLRVLTTTPSPARPDRQP